MDNVAVVNGELQLSARHTILNQSMEKLGFQNYTTAYIGQFLYIWLRPMVATAGLSCRVAPGQLTTWQKRKLPLRMDTLKSEQGQATLQYLHHFGSCRRAMATGILRSTYLR